MGTLIGDHFSKNCVNINIDEEVTLYASVLPLEVVIHLMEFLTYSDRIVASQVCQLWYEASLHPKFCNQEKVVIKKCSSETLGVFRCARKPYLHFMFIGVDVSSKMREFWCKVAPDVRSLYFSNCDMYDKILVEILSSCCNLKSLVLDNCRELFMSGQLLHSPRDVKAVSEALHNLQELSLSSNRYLSDAMFNRLLNVMPYLKSISLEGCQMSFHAGLYDKYYPNRLTADDPDFASETVLTFQNFYNIILKRAGIIKSLNLSRTLIDSNALSSISEANEFQLHELHLTRCEQLTNPGILSLAKHQTMLTVLDVSYCSRITDQSLLSICTGMSRLQKLAVRNCRAITDLGMQNVRLLTDLKELDISQCEHVTGKGIKDGLCSKINTKLLKLSMAGLNTITSATVILIAKNLPHLTHLNLSYCFNAVNDYSIQAIFQHQRHLRSLKLACCDAVTDAGLTGMGAGGAEDVEDADAEQNTSSVGVGLVVEMVSQPLLQISLRSRAEEEIVQDAYRKRAVQKMCELQHNECSRHGYSLARLKGLQELDLRHCNRITDVSLKYSFAFLELQHLNLSQCQQITHVGLQAIGENNPSIDTLNLSECHNITDEAIVALVSTLHRLKYLDIKGCTKLTKDSVMAIVEHCRQLRYLDASFCNNSTTDKISELLHRLPQQTFYSRPDPVGTQPIPPPPLLR